MSGGVIKGATQMGFFNNEPPREESLDGYFVDFLTADPKIKYILEEVKIDAYLAIQQLERVVPGRVIAATRLLSLVMRDSPTINAVVRKLSEVEGIGRRLNLLGKIVLAEYRCQTDEKHNPTRAEFTAFLEHRFRVWEQKQTMIFRV
jgi:hypothetical protein